MKSAGPRGGDLQRFSVRASTPSPHGRRSADARVLLPSANVPVLKIAYLLNTYPMTSTTFIRREIEALTAAGVEVHRFAARRWSEELVDPLDRAEQSRTHYLLSGNVRRVMLAFLKEMVINPLGIVRAAGSLSALHRNARGGLARHVAYLFQAAYFRHRARDAGIQHVHAHFATNAAAIAMLSHLLGGPGYSFTVHGPDEFENTDRLSFDLKMTNARFIAAISSFCRVQLIRASRWDHWDKIAIIRCGLFIPDFQPAEPIAEENQTFVTVARISAQKGLLLIPQALAMLKADFPNLRVKLVGDGDERARLEEDIRKYDVAGMIELLGWRPNREIAGLIRDSRALLLPSFAEGLPVVIMESFALGRPVIATYIAGIPELVDSSCGWLVPTGSVESLAAAMRCALNASVQELTEKGLEGRRRSLASHDVAESAAQLHRRFAHWCS